MALNPLVLSTREEQEDADALYMSLTQLAKPTAPKPRGAVIENIENVMKERQQLGAPVTAHANPLPNRRSRFFYSPTKSFKQVVDESKVISEPKTLPHENDESNKRVDDYSKELPAELGTRIDEIREYLLTQWAPVALAAGAATTQFLDVAQRTIGTPLDPGPMQQFERMIDRALTIKMSQFVAEYTGLSPDRAAELIESVTPRPQQVVFMGPSGDQVRSEHERRSRVRQNEKD